MRDIGIPSEDVTTVRTPPCAEGLALEVIGRLAASRKLGAIGVRDNLVEQLATAACEADLSLLPAAVEILRRAHVSDLSLVCDYIPEAARLLGQGWQDDSRSFLDVTVGVSRLTDLLNDVASWAGDEHPLPGRPSLLLLVPPGEQHTLGASVLACRLRQMGVSVCLRIAPTLAELAGLIATRGFSGAMVTLGTADRADSCAVLVKALRTLGKGSLPVVLGGAVVDQRPDLADVTGADLVTNSLEAALRLFGVETIQKT